MIFVVVTVKIYAQFDECRTRCSVRGESGRYVVSVRMG
jgi:hypothetical protein